MKGAVLFIAWHGLIEPLANKLLMPHVLGAVKKSVTSGVLNEMRKKRKEARRAIKKKIYHGVAPGADTDEEAALKRVVQVRSAAPPPPFVLSGHAASLTPY